VQLAIYGNPTVAGAAHEFLLKLFTLHPHKILPFASDDHCDLITSLLAVTFTKPTTKLIKLLVRSSPDMAEVFFSQASLERFLASIYELPLADPQLEIRIHLLARISTDSAGPKIACRDVILYFAESFPSMSDSLFRHFLTLATAGFCDLEGGDNFIPEFFQTTAFVTILSRYSPRDDVSSRFILWIVCFFSQFPECLPFLLDGGLESLLMRYSEMVHREHRLFVPVILKNMFIMDPSRQVAFLESDLARQMVETVAEEAFDLKRRILKLLCSVTRCLDLYVPFFLRWDLIQVYVECLEVQADGFRRVLVESLDNMLAWAFRHGGKELVGGMLELYENANLSEILETISGESDDEGLLSAIQSLEDTREVSPE
jgi:hypothetical protein